VRTPAEEAEDEEFFRRYGPWAPLDPPGLAEFMAGFARPWWIVGGWAIEAFTGVPREHEDVDLSILACDVPALREHVGDRWHLWSNHGGTLRPLDDRFPEVLDVESQIWVREHALAPWIIDLPLTPDRDGLWTNKRLPADEPLPLDAATWVAGDGIRYLNPEIVLLFKARLDRPKDLRDLDVAWPLLAPDRRAWLRDAVRRTDPEHAWLDRLAPDGTGDGSTASHGATEEEA
jgi:hypothetical protein